jgi:hypothetical protein
VHCGFRERSDRMSKIHASKVEQTAVLRERVIIIEKFEASKLDEAAGKKQTRITLRTVLNRLVLIGAIESIRRLFKSAAFW